MTITDTVTQASATHTYDVDLRALVGETAFVGFTAATGGLNANHDVLTWRFASLPTAPFAPGNLRATSTTSSPINLAWNASLDAAGYSVERSTDGTDFAEIARVGAGTTTFSDTGLGTGSFFYRVRAFNNLGASLPSNMTGAALGAFRIDHGAGFASNEDLTANGAAGFVGDRARLTPAANTLAGSVFSDLRVGIQNFNTFFTFQNHGGSNPRADGITFTLQGSSPTALGQFGNGLGFGQENPAAPLGIPTSVAIKFDNFEGGPVSTTGLYTNGQGPFAAGAIDLLPAIDLRDDHVIRVDMSYDGTTLTVTITDTQTLATATQTYTVNLAAIVGSDTAYVGFTSGTGGLNANHDVLNWTFDAL